MGLHASVLRSTTARSRGGEREGARQTEREKTLLNAEHDFRITEQARDRADGDSEVLRLRLGGKS